MIRSYLKVAVRHFAKKKITFLVNLLGLTIGIISTVLLVLYAAYELSYDDFHRDSKDTYRLLRTEFIGNNRQVVAKTNPRNIMSFREDFPEVVATTSLFKHWDEPLLSIGDVGFYEENFLFADSSFFDVFGYELIQGDPKSALNEPFSLVLTEEMVIKYFGNEEPLGQSVKYELGQEFIVTGVVRLNSQNKAHFTFDFLASMPSLRHVMWYDILSGNYNGFYNYVRLRPGTDLNEFTQKFGDWARLRFPDQSLSFQPLLDIHLKSNAIAEIEQQSDIMFVRVVIIIAIVVILLATINYVNSAISNSVERLKEMGVRMVSGAFGPQIFAQYISEALLIMLSAFVLSLLALFFLITPFNELLNIHLSFDFAGQWQIWLVIILILFVTGVLSGMAPAMVILRMDLTDVLRNVITIGRIGFLRKALIVFQFIVSVVMIVGAITINRQAAFIKTKDLGFNQHGVMIVPMKDRGIDSGFQGFKDKCEQIAGVSAVSRSKSIPGRPMATGYFKNVYDGLDSLLMNENWVGEDFLKTMGIELLYGLTFQESMNTTIRPIIVNETLMHAFDWGTPMESINQKIYQNGNDYTVIGVVKDFNYQSLHSQIQPLVMHPGKDLTDYISIRFAAGNSEIVANGLSQVWYDYATDQPLTHSLLTEELAQLYESERIWEKIGNLAMLVSLVIGGLGVFGLVSLVVQKRFKEIGVRKIFGASHGNIVLLVYYEFLFILLITLLIASPLGYYFASLWLTDFAYRILVPIDAFFTAMAILAGVTCLAVLFHTFRALSKNPIHSLKD